MRERGLELGYDHKMCHYDCFRVDYTAEVSVGRFDVMSLREMLDSPFYNSSNVVAE